MKDKISVIVPCYNVQKYVMRCFESIYNQTYGFDNVEIIFVDDLSTDNTYLIIESLQKRFSANVIAVQLEKKGLAGGARNLGLAMATGKYITFVDADDCLHPQMLQALWNKMKDGSYDIVQCQAKEFSEYQPDYENIDMGEMKSESFFLEEENNRKNWIIRLIGGFNVCVWGKLYSTDFIKNNDICFLENVYFEDNSFSLICILQAHKICVLEAPLIYYFVNTNGITKNNVSLNKIRDLTKNVKKICTEVEKSEIITMSNYELQAFILWKGYFETWTKLRMAYEKEKEYYKRNILNIFTKEKILNNPYISSIQDKDLLEAVEYLKG